MKRLVIFLISAAFIAAFGSNVWASCAQEPTEPAIFCVVPAVPVAGQIAQFELTELLNPSNVLWDFGDGSKVHTLGSRFVEHAFAEPGRYTVKAWVAHGGGFDGITQLVTVALRDPVFIPTPITSFDKNHNRRIDNDEFFAALDLWIADKMRDLTFFKLMDAWIAQSLIVEESGLGRGAAASISSYAVYQLDGKLVASAGCSLFSAIATLEQKLSAKNLSAGVYLAVSRDCATGAVTRRLARIR